MQTNHEIFSGKDVIITKSICRFKNDEYHHQDGRELEYFERGQFRLKGSNEADRIERVQFLIDNKDEYHEFVRLKDKFEPILDKINDYTKEEYERIHNAD
jgi:hypothetical protein